jgi:hypothetical protein
VKHVLHIGLIQIIPARVRNFSFRTVHSLEIIMQNMCNRKKMLSNVLLKIKQQQCRMRKKNLEIFRGIGSLLKRNKIRKVILLFLSEVSKF